MDYINSVLDIFQADPISQSLGILGFIASIITFYVVSDKYFVYMMIVASVFWGAHFFGLGLLSAAYINIFDVFKNAASLKWKRNKQVTAGIVLIYLVIGYFTFDGELVSTIPIITSVLGTFILFFLEGIKLRLGFMVILILWFIYNYVGQSIGGVMSDLTLMIVGLIGIMRIVFHLEKKKNTEEKASS
ncbi:MAG: YgjV family protein [Candidatus Gracilibacteria bacterium]|nr:YgjV family protein [Candidatus Gracilibacteria bacterium]